MKNQQGFTLIELIVVIVILGILAATALPRFVNMQAAARVASLNGLAGGIRSGVAVISSRYILTGVNTSTTVNTQDGTAVTVNAGTGIPVGTAAGIGAVLQSLDGYAAPDYTDPTAVVLQPANGGSLTCRITYNGTTGAVSAIPTEAQCQ